MPHERLYNRSSDKDSCKAGEERYDHFSIFLGGSLIKRVSLDNKDKIAQLKNEVDISRKFCKVERPNFSMPRECNSDFVADFYGCVVDQQAAYLFVGKALGPNFTYQQKSQFSSTNHLDRVISMLNIIDMFISLHATAYVHGDIKPENILGNDLSQEFKMIGFRYTNKVGGQFLGGAGPFHAPERRLKGSPAT